MAFIDLLNDEVTVNPERAKLARDLTVIANRMMSGYYKQTTLTPRQKLLMLTGDKYIFIEQSLQKASIWGALAREGEFPVTQVFTKSDRKPFAVVVGDQVLFYGDGLNAEEWIAGVINRSYDKELEAQERAHYSKPETYHEDDAQASLFE